MLSGLVAAPVSATTTTLRVWAQRHLGVRGFASAAGPVRQMIASTVYVSEGRDAAIMSDLAAVAAAHPRVALVNNFIDEPYHRSSYTLVSPDAPALRSVIASISRAALARLDMREHAASHPRLGVVDHISCHALDPSDQRQLAADLAVQVASDLAAGEPSIPVYTYGDAHPEGRGLADVRRALGYFDGSKKGAWDGTAVPSGSLEHYLPDHGPKEADMRYGIATVGAVPWIINFNVPLKTSDIAVGRKLARAIGERAGGLASVQAMALPHEGGMVEVACNLLNPQVSPPDVVEARLKELAAQESVELGQSYEIGKTVRHMLELTDAKLASGSQGGGD